MLTFPPVALSVLVVEVVATVEIAILSSVVVVEVLWPELVAVAHHLQLL